MTTLSRRSLFRATVALGAGRLIPGPLVPQLEAPMALSAAIGEAFYDLCGAGLQRSWWPSLALMLARAKDYELRTSGVRRLTDPLLPIAREVMAARLSSLGT